MRIFFKKALDKIRIYGIMKSGMIPNIKERSPPYGKKSFCRREELQGNLPRVSERFLKASEKEK